jgi:hypothetical protein
MSAPWRQRRLNNNNRSAGDDEPKTDCRAELCAAGITSPKLLKRWMLLNHPDKICHYDTTTDVGRKANEDCFRKTNGRFIVVSECGKKPEQIPSDCMTKPTAAAAAFPSSVQVPSTAKPTSTTTTASKAEPPPAGQFPFSKADEPSKQSTYEDFKKANAAKTAAEADDDDENLFRRRKQAAVARSMSSVRKPVFDIDKPPDFSKLSASKACAWLTAAAAAIDERQNRCNDSYERNLRDLEDDLRLRIGKAADAKIDELKQAAAAAAGPALQQKTSAERKAAEAAIYAAYFGPDAATNAFARAEIDGRLQLVERKLAELQPVWLSAIRSSIAKQLNERISAVRSAESKNIDAAVKNLRQSTPNICAASADRIRLALRTKLSTADAFLQAARLRCPDAFLVT